VTCAFSSQVLPSCVVRAASRRARAALLLLHLGQALMLLFCALLRQPLPRCLAQVGAPYTAACAAAPSTANVLLRHEQP
jgi:hypothetical protein